jgi:hypothetical protein
VDIQYPTIDEPANPEYVLAVLRDMHRQQCQHDSAADRDVTLSFDTTIADWRRACDLLGWRKLGRAHNELWGLNYSDEEWRAVLEPPRSKRLADVCDLIARQGRHPRIRPARLLGSDCAAAGAFLTIRSLLRESGAQARDIAPSTRLQPYARRYAVVFLGPISRLAPGALPQVRIRTPVYDAGIYSILVGMLCLLLGVFGQSSLTIVGVVLYALGYALTWFAAVYLGPASVDFGEMQTFRDLAVAIGEGTRC